MKFELGKCYQHTTGHKLAVIGLVDSHLYGSSLMAETNDDNERFMCVGRDESATANYTEITREEFRKNYISED